MKSGRRPRTTATALVAAASMLLVGCGNSGQDAKPGESGVTPIKVAFISGGTIDIIWEVAKEKDFFTKEGLKPEFVKFTSGPALGAAVSSGSVDVGMGAAAASFGLIKSGGKLVVLDDYAQRLNLLIAVKKDKYPAAADAAFPDNVKALKGLKIGVPALGAAGQQFVTVALRSAGVDPAEVTFIATGDVSTAQAALKQGRVDALVLAKASLTSMQAAGIETVTAFSALDAPKTGAGAGLGQALQVVDTTSQNFKKDHPEALKSYCKAMKSAAAWAQDSKNDDAVSAIVAKSLSLPADKAKEVWVHDKPTFSDTLPASVWDAQPEWVTGPGGKPAYNTAVFSGCGS